jgi:hypothetical protein
MAKRKKNHSRKKQPIAVTVIAVAIVVLFLIRLYQVFEPLFRQQVFQNGITGRLFEGWKLTSLSMALLSSVSYFILSLAGIVVLIGFLRLRRWSWILLIAWTGLSLLITLINYFYGQPNYAVMLSNVIIAFALSNADVQRIFGIRSDENVPGL